MKILLLSFLSALSALSHAALAATPIFVRVAVVDNSPSMSGDRIAAVRTELLSVVRQLPPSDAYPLVFIVFHGTVEPTQIFTDRAAAEKAISALNADGTGTVIAPALVQAHEELKKHLRTSGVLVMLFTDGEDSDQRAIEDAETKLDSVFADRHKRGLGQTVFVKRWGNANANLIARIQKNGHAQLLDAGDLSIEPVTLSPAVRLLAARRSPTDPTRLQIVCVPSVAVQGKRPQGLLPTFAFTCRNTGAVAAKPLLATPGTASAQFVITVPIPANAERAGKLNLVFHVAPLTQPTAKGSFVLPMLPSSTVVLPVPLPPARVKNLIAAHITAASATVWEDPFAQRVRCQVVVAVTVKAAETNTRESRATTFRIVPAAGARLIGSGELVTPGPGAYTANLTLDVPLNEPKKTLLQTADIELRIEPKQKPDHVVCEPASLIVKQAGLTAPSPVTTLITPEVKRIGRPVWVDVVEPVAAFDADVAFRVVGPIPKNVTLGLVVPGNVRGNVLPPNAQLHAGDTVLTLRVLAKLSPGKPERLDFSIVPPPATPAVTFRVERGFALAVVGPPPARLIHHAGATARSAIHVDAADNQDSVQVAIVPSLHGVRADALRRSPNVKLRNGTSAASDVSAAVSQPTTLAIPIPPPSDQPFFVDLDQTVAVNLDSDAAAVLPGRVQVVVHRRAPFKRLLTYLAWALFPSGILFLAVRGVRRFREPLAV